ncbi:MAG TPA: PadR family transcriptional regulator [Vineibacter sp.]|nr:PadR family transcriptional regulator [Vineibacter sp.]
MGGLDCGWREPWVYAMGGGRGGYRHGHGYGGYGFGGGGFGRGGGGGRVFGPGDLRLVLLALVAEQPRYGYQLIKEIEQRFGGTYAPSPGSVYPTLTLLEETGQITTRDADGPKRLFEITDEGRAYLAENRAAVEGVLHRMDVAARSMAGGVEPSSVHQAVHTLYAAVRFHRRGWDATETERVRRIIERAAQEISGG